MISLSPITGNIHDTIFTLTSNEGLGEYLVNWGDGSIGGISSTTQHIYSAANIYDVSVTNCNAVSSFSLTAFPGAFLSDAVHVSYDTATSYAGCHNTFTLNLSSYKELFTVHLYNSGSSAQPATTNDSFWSHLNPEWGFYDTESNLVESLHIVGSPVYSGTNVVGYTAVSAVSFKDDIYGDRVLFFTIDEQDRGVKINSRAYAGIPYTLSALPPTKLSITGDGVNPINNIQWSDRDIPFVTVVVGENSACSSITHYASGYLTDIKFVDGCFGILPSAYVIGSSVPTLYDENCFYAGAYTHHTLNIPISAIPENQIMFAPIKCGTNPQEVDIEFIRRSPFQMVLTASGIFEVDGNVYSLTGQSDPFNVYRFENFHDFYRYGEDTNVYDLIKRYNHFNLDELPMFDQYLESVLGPGDTLGKVYDKIQNLSQDHHDLDTCRIDSIYDIAQKLDTDVHDFGLEFPEELRRMMDFGSIPLQKLVGSRKNKDGKIGLRIELCDIVTGGEIIAYSEAGTDELRYYEVVSTTPLSQLSTVNTFPNFDKLCFYRWHDEAQVEVVDSYINYNDARNRLSKSLTKQSEWYSTNGVLEESFNYILTKYLVDGENIS